MEVLEWLGHVLWHIIVHNSNPAQLFLLSATFDPLSK